MLNVRHDGSPSSAKEVIVDYSTAGKLYEVRGRACVMACWNMFIPYLVPELSSAQKEALAHNVKAPIVYTNVFLRNWRAFEKLGVGYVDCPTMYHDTVELTEASDLGDLHHARNPDEPIAVRMTRMPASPVYPQRAISDWACRSPGNFFRDFRAQHSRSVGENAVAGRVRSGAGHHRDRCQSLASWLFVYL